MLTNPDQTMYFATEEDAASVHVHCRKCGDPMETIAQKTFKGEWIPVITCKNPECGMFTYTLCAVDYHDIDLEARYLKGCSK